MTKSQIDTTVRVRIARVHSNAEPYDSFELHVSDEKSGVLFLSVELTPEQYATVVSCGSDAAGLIPTFRGMEYVGMRHENKTIEIVLPLDDTNWGDAFMVKVREAASEFEVDGWGFRESDLKQFNGHRLKRSNDEGVQRYSLHMFRFVEDA